MRNLEYSSLCPLRIFLKSYVCEAWKNHVLTWLYFNIRNMMMIQLCLCSFVFLSDLGSGLEAMSCQNMPDWLFLKAGLWRSSCQCVKVTVGKSCWWWLFCCGFFSLPHVLLYQEVTRTVCQEKPSWQSYLPHRQTWAWLRPVFTPGLCRWPFAHKGSTGDLVLLRTKNLKYCRCVSNNLPGPLSHIPKFWTAR